MDFSSANLLLQKFLESIPNISIGSEYLKYLEFWPIFLIGLISSFILTPLIGYIAIKGDITYKPHTKRKGREFDNQAKAMHEGITPALGGLAISIPIFVAILLFFKIDGFTIPILIALGILILGSFLDDVFNLPAGIQFLYQILAAGIIAFSIIDLTSISFLDIELQRRTLSFSLIGIQQSFVFPGDLILFIWILICINSVKWTAGSPGIVEANSFVIFSLIFIIAVREASLFSSTLSILTAGTLLTFLYFAFPPQKIMSGSVGKTIYGFLICLLAIIADIKISTTIMLLLLPLIDFIYVIIKRIFINKPKNIMELMKINDTNHLHHQLLKLNISRKNVVLIEMSATLLLGSFAILTTGALRYFAIILGIAIGMAFIVFINIKATTRQEDDEEPKSPESKYSY
jgi:UDP-GlcNAc:undecaprenyl-phosphate/decaprenyl-phosphate GlcNAc-1-phosphate transferase